MPVPALPPDNGPKLLHISYARQQPPGADRPFWGLRLPTFDPDGQAVSVTVAQVAPRGPLAHLDGGCLHPAPNGVRHDWFLPGYLAPGRYRFRITVSTSTCDPADPRAQERTFERVLRVRAPKRRSS